MAPGFHHVMRLRYGTRYPSPSASCRVLCVSWYPGHSVLWRVMGDAGWSRGSLTVFLCLI